MIILLSKYNTLCDMFNMIQLQYNMAKNIMYLYLDSPTAEQVSGTSNIERLGPNPENTKFEVRVCHHPLN